MVIVTNELMDTYLTNTMLETSLCRFDCKNIYSGNGKNSQSKVIKVLNSNIIKMIF